MNKLYLLCYRLHLELGGLPRIVLNKANILTEKGYDVSIITIEHNNDYKFIEKELKKRNQLNSSVEMINIYDFFEMNNTNLNGKFASKLKNYFKLFTLRKMGYPLREHKHVSKKKYFTKDGFCYLIELFVKNRKLALFYIDRPTGKVFKFKDDLEFQDHFYRKICISNNEKPFLICEGSGPTPTISKVDQEIAYKISNLHSNPYTGPYCFGGPIRNIGVLNNIEKNHAFVTLTENQRKDIIKQLGDFGNVITIPNFVPKRNLLDLEKDPNKISIFTRIAHEKNLEDAIKSFRIVVNKRKNARLEIFGRATLPEEKRELIKIENLIKELNLSNNVFINGYIQNVDVEMTESIVTLLTSKFEGFPMALLESMVNSTPVISYDLNYGPSDAIDHGINGFLVEYGDIESMANFMIILLDDTKKAKKMGELARKKILDFYSDEAVIPVWEKLFRNLTLQE
ncbi:MAG: hypothetical protein CVV28_11880 [Methanobacteriales archaeon HGW-Methanobacteriales-1]|jgi:glycosyltransferase involved in cell wall biosynthesis|nr:MAG: hypothetical protein CVV28_11880 [Methanobacteriales archaeon HGW-Methanobacteriales-1]